MKKETGELLAPVHQDSLVMEPQCSGIQQKLIKFQSSPIVRGIQFNEKTCFKVTRGEWDWKLA